MDATHHTSKQEGKRQRQIPRGAGIYYTAQSFDLSYPVDVIAMYDPPDTYSYMYKVQPAHESLPPVAEDDPRRYKWYESRKEKPVLRSVPFYERLDDDVIRPPKMEPGLITAVVHDKKHPECRDARVLIIDMFQHPDEPAFILVVVVWLWSKDDLRRKRMRHNWPEGKDWMVSSHFQVLPADSIKGLGGQPKNVDLEHVLDVTPLAVGERRQIRTLAATNRCDLVEAVEAHKRLMSRQPAHNHGYQTRRVVAVVP